MENKKIIQTILFSARLALLNTFSQGKAHASMVLRSLMCLLLFFFAFCVDWKISFASENCNWHRYECGGKFA